MYNVFIQLTYYRLTVTDFDGASNSTIAIVTVMEGKICMIFCIQKYLYENLRLRMKVLCSYF